MSWGTLSRVNHRASGPDLRWRLATTGWVFRTSVYKSAQSSHFRVRQWNQWTLSSLALLASVWAWTRLLGKMKNPAEQPKRAGWPRRQRLASVRDHYYTSETSLRMGLQLSTRSMSCSDLIDRAQASVGSPSSGKRKQLSITLKTLRITIMLLMRSIWTLGSSRIRATNSILLWLRSLLPFSVRTSSRTAEVHLKISRTQADLISYKSRSSVCLSHRGRRCRHSC